MSVINVTGLEVFAVCCTDLEEAKKFYVEKLGFVEGMEMSPGLMLSAGELSIYLEPGRSPSDRDSMKIPAISPCFGTNRVKTSFQKLKESGVKIVTECVEDAPTFGMFRIADPDGNVIEFTGQP